jgi:hypothetical protein
VAKKSEVVARVVKAIQPRHPLPESPAEGFTLLEQGLYAVLHRHLTTKQAEQTVIALRGGFDDWNELRVSQAQEIAPFIKTSSRKKGLELLNDRKETALLIKDYLQDVFQEVHGLELEPLLEDAAWAGQIIAEFKVLGLVGGAWLLWVGSGGKVPVHLPLLKMLDKLGWTARTTSLTKGRDMVDKLVPAGMEREFTIAMHEIVERWGDEDAPIYAEVEALREVPAAKKAHADWVQAVKRAEVQREREEARRIAAEKKEAERLRKEEEKERKRIEAEAKKKARELERKRKVEEKKRAAAKAKEDAAKEAKRKAEEQKKAAEAQKREAAAKKEAAKKEAARKAAAAKKAAEKKAATAKKAAAKKAAAKKAAAKKAAAKKAASKKTASKKTASKKKAAAKKTASKKKVTAKKTTAKKTASKKKPTAVSKKATAKKTASKKKATPKKTASKKKATAKKTARKR